MLYNLAPNAPEQPGPPLSEAERQPCEVWTRVMGYHRPVSSFNIGKKGEHLQRVPFREPKSLRIPTSPA